MQKRLIPSNPKYSHGPYNKADEREQWIRLSEGCPHDCPWCYEPQKIEVYPIPGIIRNQVKIMDMNLLCKPRALAIIKELGTRKVNGKFVHYELICGIDYRFLTISIAFALKENSFDNIRIAWDGQLKEQREIDSAITKLTIAGYRPQDIMVFMICNHESISYTDSLTKLDLCKVWHVMVSDCYYDNQTSPNIIPLGWKDQQIKDFRHRCRKHNQYINFHIDPEL